MFTDIDEYVSDKVGTISISRKRFIARSEAALLCRFISYNVRKKHQNQYKMWDLKLLNCIKKTEKFINNLDAAYCCLHVVLMAWWIKRTLVKNFISFSHFTFHISFIYSIDLFFFPTDPPSCHHHSNIGVEWIKKGINDGNEKNISLWFCSIIWKISHAYHQNNVICRIFFSPSAMPRKFFISPSRFLINEMRWNPFIHLLWKFFYCWYSRDFMIHHLHYCL